jgi:hypothetical protein
VNAPFQNPLVEEPTEIEVTDPTHPLYGRRFSLAAIRRPRPTAGHVLVTYGDRMLLRLPIDATNLASRPRPMGTKLSQAAVSEFVALGMQDELTWAFGSNTSGTACPQTSNRKLSTSCARSCRR